MVALTRSIRPQCRFPVAEPPVPRGLGEFGVGSDELLHSVEIGVRGANHGPNQLGILCRERRSWIGRLSRAANQWTTLQPCTYRAERGRDEE